MPARFVWLWLVILCTGCHFLGLLEGRDDPAAERSWQQGQEAMRRGEPQAAIDFYQQSLTSAPEFSRAHLSLAAAHLETGEEANACAELGRYVAEHPEELTLRAQLAELLLRLRRADEAHAELERLAADAQDQVADHAVIRIHCHRRLMEIAEAGEDEYGEHLHRGIGLYLLARQRVELPDPDDELPVEGLLCKAAAELTLAHLARPELARPPWYLYEVWSRLAQRQPALQYLNAAEEASPFLDLTAAECRGLELAWQQYRSEGPKKL